MKQPVGSAFLLALKASTRKIPLVRLCLPLAAYAFAVVVVSAQTVPSPRPAAISDPLAEMRAHPAKLAEKKFAELSDQTIGEKGKLALDTSANWRQGETDHFVIHFLRVTEAQRLARDAEFYYAKIKADLAPLEDRARGKSHLFLFDRDEKWTKFRARAGLAPWTAGVAIGSEFFFAAQTNSSAAVANQERLLAHEITHVICGRFITRPLPLWLSEGFAEFQAEDAFRKLKGLGPPPAQNPQPKKLSLAQLTSISQYPEASDDVTTLYHESERLISFLIARHDRKLFVPFVTDLTDGAKFDDALLKIYGAKYKTLKDFEKAYQYF